ncbi:MAG TPA: hypothetical protein VMR70_21420 [Flavisolibacter sp.]|nr:hypothetical protein [Flavisolibacter sp.]
MRVILVFIFLLPAVVEAQPMSKYTAIYSKHIETALSLSPDKVRMNVGDNPVAKEMAEQTLNDLAGTSLQLRFMDSLLVRSDSVIAYQVPCAPPQVGGTVRLNIKPTQMVIKPDRYYQVKNGAPEMAKQRTTPTLVKTGVIEGVLDYSCEVFQTEDSKLKVWLCKELPSTINAGLPLLIPIGAVLKYELRDKTQKVTATLFKLSHHVDRE